MAKRPKPKKPHPRVRKAAKKKKPLRRRKRLSPGVQRKQLLQRRFVAECKRFQQWITDHPQVRAAIAWETPSGMSAYSDWSADQRQDLCRGYWTLSQGRQIVLDDPPPNIKVLGDNDSPRTVLGEKHAWLIYSSHVVNSIFVERKQAVGWSMLADSALNLSRLLDSRSFFLYRAEESGYEIGRYSPELQYSGASVPASPTFCRSFIESGGLLGESRLDTIGLVLDWCRENLLHFENGYTAKNMEDHWQYRGYPPVSRVINGTTHNGIAGHYTAGCAGTTGFLQALLRSVNIPVEHIAPEGAGHAMPKFSSESRYLSHGDDPYSQLSHATPPYPAVELLIDEATYQEWFGDALTDDQRKNNIGRRVFELALSYLPDRLLRDYCDDSAGGRTHAASHVYANFSRWYSVSDLEAMGLWNRLAAKVAGLGGCGNIP